MKPTVELGDGSPTGLSTLRPDAVRSARTRQRCRAVLQSHPRAADPVAPEPNTGGGRGQPTAGERAFRNALAGAVGILCLVYVVALIATTVSLQGAMH